MEETCKEHSGVCKSIENIESSIAQIKSSQADMMKLVIGTLIGVSIQLVFFILNNLPQVKAIP